MGQLASDSLHCCLGSGPPDTAQGPRDPSPLWAPCLHLGPQGAPQTDRLWAWTQRPPQPELLPGPSSCRNGKQVTMSQPQGAWSTREPPLHPEATSAWSPHRPPSTPGWSGRLWDRWAAPAPSSGPQGARVETGHRLVPCCPGLSGWYPSAQSVGTPPCVAGRTAPDPSTYLGHGCEPRGGLWVPHVRLCGPDQQGVPAGGAKGSVDAVQLLGVAHLWKTRGGSGSRPGASQAWGVGCGVWAGRSPWSPCRGPRYTPETPGPAQPARTGSG